MGTTPHTAQDRPVPLRWSLQEESWQMQPAADRAALNSELFSMIDREMDHNLDEAVLL